MINLNKKYIGKISRLEKGEYNPSLKFLKKLAQGLGKELHIEFK